MSNYVSNENATALMSAIGKKKLTVTDVMPLAASAANEGIPYLYLGATTQDFTNGSIYECQEVTPATDPKTYEWVEKYQSNVDLSFYKRIWGGTEDGWNQLTDEQKANYEYTFFSGDSDYTLDVIDAVTNGDMRPVSSNAVYDYTVDSVVDGNMHPVTSNAVADKAVELQNEMPNYRYVDYDNNPTNITLSATPTAISKDGVMFFSAVYCTNTTSGTLYFQLMVNGHATICGSISPNTNTIRPITGSLALKKGDTVAYQIPASGLTVQAATASFYPYRN